MTKTGTPWKLPAAHAAEGGKELHMVPSPLTLEKISSGLQKKETA